MKHGIFIGHLGNDGISGLMYFTFGDAFGTRTGMLLVGVACGLVHAIDKWANKPE